MEKLDNTEREAAQAVIAGLTAYQTFGESNEEIYDEIFRGIDAQTAFLVLFGLYCGLIDAYCMEMGVDPLDYTQSLGLAVASAS